MAIFDLDGTLLDTSSSICRTLMFTLDELKLPPLESNQIIGAIGKPLKEILLPLKLPIDIEEAVVKRFRELLQVDIQRGVKTFPGVIEFVTDLDRRSIRLSVATSKPTLLAKESVKFSQLSSFDFTILGSDGLKSKPNPEVVQKVISLYPGVGNIVMFGDRVEDAMAARAAGIKSVGIAQSTHSMDDLLNAGANLTFNSFEEVNQNIEKVFDLFDFRHHVQ